MVLQIKFGKRCKPTAMEFNMNTLKTWLSRPAKTSLMILAALSWPGVASADDMDVYLDQTTLPAEETRPVVVFVLDSSGSMGSPMDSSRSRRQEHSHYSSSTTYDAKTNYAGGAGVSDYIYLYRIADSYANEYRYVNKVHIDQIDEATCSSTLASSNRRNSNPNRYEANSGYDTYLFGDPSDTSNWQDMCDETDSSCSFVSGSASSHKVDCESANTYITNDSDFPSDSAGNDREENGLFAFDYNIHNYLQGYYRYTTMQQVVKDIVDSDYDVNLSLMRFTGSSGGYVLQDSLLATDSGNQATLKTAITKILPEDSTPLTESLWEAAKYLRGETATYGYVTGRDTDAFTSAASNTYSSPIEYACQKSHVVLLTDGEPTNDNGVDSLISALDGVGTCSHASSGTVDTVGESCLDDLARWLRYDAGSATYGTAGDYTRGTLTNDYVRDHRINTDVTANPPSVFSDAQSIAVNTIGFGLNNNLLIQTAAGPGGHGSGFLTDGGGGINETADTAAQLEDAFSSILDNVDYQSNTNVAPAVAINSYSGLQHREELYFALYKPANSPRWYGNVKKYKLIDGVITATGNEAAIDTSTGYFKEDVTSFWTNARDLDGDGDTDEFGNTSNDDGNDITIGGLATNLTTPTSRSMYTYTGTAPVNTGTTPTPVNLTGELLNTSNTNINANPGLLSDGTTTVSTTGEAADIINWVRGGTTDYNAAGQTSPNIQPNFFVADIVHNPPAIVTYVTDTSSSGCTDSPCFTDYLFAGSNMGTFHAINPDDSAGTELWSFVPKELLPNLTTYYKSLGSFTSKVYGLDGPMQVWRYDANSDGSITTAAGDHVYIYQPMRRGGTSIYAFDVTTITSPKLLWQINGTGLDTTPSGDYADLAQTWSAPQRATILWNSAQREVLFFGGGYDPDHDTATSPPSSSRGNAIFMVDATTGLLLWSAGDSSPHDYINANMTQSFTADLSVSDVDGDGAADVMFAVDITGNLWRFDFSKTATSASNFVGSNAGRIAQLGGTGADFRRFYNAPDVALFAQRGSSSFFTISIPSGHREDPREEVISDYLFVLFDENVFSAPANYGYNSGSAISASDLTTANLDPNTTVSIGAYGWKLALAGTGEKGLSETVTFNGKILMSTYLPDSASTCVGTLGSGRYYIVNALTGVSTIIDDNGTANDTSDDTRTAYRTLEKPGIPPKPVVIFGTEDVCVADCSTSNPTYEQRGTLTACVGPECEEEPEPPLHKTYWREN